MKDEITKKKLTTGDVVLNAIVILLAVMSIFPLYWMITSAFKNTTEVIRTPPTFWPLNPTIQNFIDIFKTTLAARWLLNSLIVGVFTTGLIVIISAMAAYAFAKLEFVGRDFWFIVLICTMMIPKEVIVVPMFRIVKGLGWMDSYSGLIIPGVATAVGVFMLKNFFAAIPDSLREAAKIDGCTEFGIFIKIILPLGKAGIGALFILQFVTVWNDYLWQLVIAQTTPMQTLMVGIATMFNENNPNFAYKFAGAAIGAIPMIIIFMMFQKNFTRGITLGGEKG